MRSVQRSPGSRSLFDFDRIAHTYDAWYSTPVGSMVDKLEKRAVEAFLAPAEKCERLLDVGCGTGHWSEYFVREGYRVTGVDIAEKMLQQASKKRIPEATFVAADAARLPFADGSFHVSVAMTVLEFVLDDPAVIVAEMARCTKKEGLVLVGALNRYSLMAFQRRWRSDPVFREARLFSFWQLRDLLARLGTPRVVGSAFCLPSVRALPLAGVMESVGSVLVPFLGSFFVGGVRVWK